LKKKEVDGVKGLVKQCDKQRYRYSRHETRPVHGFTDTRETRREWKKTSERTRITDGTERGRATEIYRKIRSK